MTPSDSSDSRDSSEPSLADLLGPWRVGEPLDCVDVPPHSLRSVGTAGGLSLWLAGPHGDVRVDVYPLEPTGAARPQRAAAHTALLGLSYRGLEPMPPAMGKRLCEAVALRIGQHESAVISALQQHHGNTRIRSVRGGPLLTRMGHGHEAFYGLDPYIGCLIGCRFCYAQGRAQAWRRLLGLRDARWGSWVDVREDAPEVLAAELDTLPPLPIKLSPLVTDPYQAIERQHRITRRCLEVLVARASPPPVIVLTRSELVLDDLALLRALPEAWVGMSIPGLDDAVRQRLEPGAATIDQRLETLATLRDAGLRTFAVIQPVLPGDPQLLAAALAAVVSSATVDTLHGSYGATGEFAAGDLTVATTEAWQRQQHAAVVAALRAAGMNVWRGELPIQLAAELPVAALPT